MPTALPDAVPPLGAAATEAQLKTFHQNVRAAIAEMGDPTGLFGVIQNLSLVFTVAANALTIAVKDRAGADPTAVAPSSPLSVPFRNPTVATGDFSVLNITAASSLVLSSGSTAGTRANIPFRLWIVAFNDAGIWRVGAINCVTTVAGAGAGSDVTAIYPLKGWGIASSTAEGGAGAADSAQTIYTSTAVTAKAYVVLGYATWETGLAPPGTWSAGPTRIQLFGVGVPLPGDLIQVQRIDTGASTTGTTLVPSDDTIPSNTEGDQFMAAPAIVPSSAANVLRMSAQGHFTSSSINQFAMSFYQDAVVNALKTAHQLITNVASVIQMFAEHIMLAGATASTTFKVRAGGTTAGTTTFNGSAGARLYGGVLNSFVHVEELMG